MDTPRRLFFFLTHRAVFAEFFLSDITVGAFVQISVRLGHEHPRGIGNGITFQIFLPVWRDNADNAAGRLSRVLLWRKGR